MAWVGRMGGGGRRGGAVMRGFGIGRVEGGVEEMGTGRVAPGWMGLETRKSDLVVVGVVNLALMAPGSYPGAGAAN